MSPTEEPSHRPRATTPTPPAVPGGLTSRNRTESRSPFKMFHRIEQCYAGESVDRLVRSVNGLFPPRGIPSLIEKLPVVRTGSSGKTSRQGPRWARLPTHGKPTPCRAPFTLVGSAIPKRRILLELAPHLHDFSDW